MRGEGFTLPTSKRDQVQQKAQYRQLFFNKDFYQEYHSVTPQTSIV